MAKDCTSKVMEKRFIGLETLSNGAARRYHLATVAITIAAATLMMDILYLRPGPPSIQHKAFGIVLVLSAIYTHLWLYASHEYYRKMAQNGCAPATTYRNNPLGIPFLLETGRGIKQHTLLQLRVKQFATLGHTFRQMMFPSTIMSYTTDDPENIKTMLSTKFEDWVIPSLRVRGFKPVLGDHSIFTTNGPEWQHSRATLRPAFVRDQISDLACFDKHITKLIAQIPRDGSRFDIQNLFSMLTIDSISDFMFGQTTDVLGKALERDIQFGQWFDAALMKIGFRARLGWLTMLFPEPELKKYARFVHSYVDDLLEAKKEQLKTGKGQEQQRKYVFLDELLHQGEPDEVIRGQLLSIFLAGRDTTTSVLTYLFYELSRRPEVVSKIQREIRELGEEDPTWEQLKNMKYLSWAVKEALRLNPPVPLNGREAIRDTILPVGGGPDGKSPIFIPKGTDVRYDVWSMQRRQDRFGDDADQFIPERWESLKPGFEYLPFNAGPRICIGQNFALTQMAMVTFRLLQTFQTIEAKDDRPPVLRLAINTSLLNGCWVSVTPA
ncbi:hypothetical protein KJ359_001090 [Pestalotiopsis sp. 9143b]|nr:hypothetical protein KJ359_001090 [Pestalotiopsis sp. 9143b]